MMWSNGGAGWTGWLLMSVGMLAFWALVVVAIIALFRGERGDRSRWARGPGNDDPLRLLDERFARGEIDLEDYQIRRPLLTKPR